jgi:succinyl-diaminopimelate desuccinylase
MQIKSGNKVIEEKIKEKIDGYRQQVVDTLCELIAIPTVNPPGKSYQECVNYLSKKLKDWEIKHQVIAVPNKNYPRFSIIGFYGQGEPSLLFHGHYDVVPEFSSEQFKPRIKGDRIYGRGSSDMKGGLVAMLFALLAVKACGLKLKGKIAFSLVPDEESGGRLGTQHLIESGLLPQPSLGMLMPEPTSSVIWNANKGALTFKVEVKGKSAHVGLAHEAKNAFEQMVEIAHSLLELRKHIRRRKTEMPINPPEANRSVMLLGGESGSGVSYNVVPDRAFFTIDRRINPEENLDEAKRELMRLLENYNKKGIEIEVKILQEGEPSAADAKASLASALKQTIKDVTGKIPRFELSPGLVEIRFFNKRRIPGFAYGPGLLEVSHRADEYIRISDILNCARIYSLTAARLLT